MLKRAFEALKSPVTAGVNEKEEDEAICVDETGVDIAEALEILHSGDNLENKDLSEKEIRVFDTEDGKETTERETKCTEETKSVTKPIEETKFGKKPLEETKNVKIKKPHVETIHSPTVGDITKVVEKYFQNVQTGENPLYGGNTLLNFLHSELSKQSSKQTQSSMQPVKRRILPRPPKPIKDNVKQAIAQAKKRLARDFVINNLTLPQINTPSKNESFNEQIKQLTSSNCEKSKLSFEEYFSDERENEICLYFCAIFNKHCFQNEVTVVVSIRNFNILIIDKTDEAKQLFQLSINDIKYIQILDNLQEITIISSLAPLPLCFPRRKICGDFLSSVEYLVRSRTPQRSQLLQHEPPGPLLTKPIIQSFLVSIRTTNPGLALQRIGTFMYSFPSSMSCTSPLEPSTDQYAISASTEAITDIIPIDAKLNIKWSPGNFFVKAGALYVFGVEENLLPVISEKLLEGGCSLHTETSSSERPHIVEVVLQDSTVLQVATSQDQQAEWFRNKINNAANFLQEDVSNAELVSCELVISSLEFGCFINNVSTHNLDFEYFTCNDFNHEDDRVKPSNDDEEDKKKMVTVNKGRTGSIGGLGGQDIMREDSKSKNKLEASGDVDFIWRILSSNIQHLNLDTNHCTAKITMREDSGSEDVSLTFPGQEELTAFHSLVKDLSVTVLDTNLSKGL